MNHPLNVIHNTLTEALALLAETPRNNLAIAELIQKSMDLTAELPTAPGWGSGTPTVMPGDVHHIICLQFEYPVIFATDPHFDYNVSAVKEELKLYGIERGQRIVFDLLCCNGSSSRFFEGVYNPKFMGGVELDRPVPLEQWDELRELHAQPLAHYMNDGLLTTTLLTPAQEYMLRNGKAFPIRRQGE